MTTDTPHAYALTLHFTRPPFKDMIKIQSSDDVYQYMRDRIDTGVLNHKEYLWIIITTRANRILGYKEISSGSSYATAVPCKEIAQVCLLANASACVLIHNHPSGNLNPSEGDLHVTNKIVAVLNLIEVKLLDHLIITQEGYFSFVDNDVLQPP